MKKQIIVTGGSGFVGISLIKKLISENYYPIIIDNFSNADIRLLNKIPKLKYFLIKENILNTKKIKSKLSIFKPKTIVHLAAIHYIPYCLKYPKKTLKTNVQGTELLLKLSLEIGVKNFIFISSGAVYKPSNIPHKEKDKIDPIDVYGISKKLGENIVKNFSIKNGISYKIIRLFNVYGKNDLTPHFIPSILNKIKKSNILEVGNIKTYRDYIYINDVIDAIFQIVDNDKKQCSLYNLGTGKEYSGEEIIKTIEKLLNIKIIIKKNKKLIRETDRKILVANIDKISKDYFWKPKYSIYKGLKDMLIKQ